MRSSYRRRRLTASGIVAIAIAIALYFAPDLWQQTPTAPSGVTATGSAAEALSALPVKGRAPKTNYSRTQFGDGWAMKGGCDTRNIILHRDLTNVAVNESCKVLSGVLQDPYTGQTIQFVRGGDTSDDVQIDHVVALSDAWQKGAQQLTKEERIELANDPLELIAVEGKANQEKSDSDAATWLPPNKTFRCQYVARQIAVKAKYSLWVTQAERDKMVEVLSECAGQTLPTA